LPTVVSRFAAISLAACRTSASISTVVRMHQSSRITHHVSSHRHRTSLAHPDEATHQLVGRFPAIEKQEWWPRRSPVRTPFAFLSSISTPADEQRSLSAGSNPRPIPTIPDARLAGGVTADGASHLAHRPARLSTLVGPRLWG
jgi:hypothetical protein